ncbi:MAG: SGNH/GDSL hydrolase family protein [Pseudomonadota bacterium]
MKTVLCYGDSNTHGTKPLTALGRRERFDPTVRWPRRLAQRLAGRWEVIEAGLPSRTTLHDDPIQGAHKNGLTVLPALLESHCPLDRVIVMLGTNDLQVRYSMTAEDIARSMERLALVILASGAGPAETAPDVLLVAPPPVEEAGCLHITFGGGAAKSRDVAGHLRAAADRVGVGFFDAGAHVAPSGVDGVHLDEAGHAALAEALAATFD